MPRVRKIEANELPVLPGIQKKTRVAAYARVSTGHEEQDGSFEMQVGYYTNKIKNEPDWELVRVFADKGASGTCIAGREAFQAMVESAKNGEIDLILTKSISRFARNTVTTLETIRELKEKGVAVEFEKENLRTDTNQGELMLTILSALAEQESKSISENIQWGIKAKFKEGKDVHNFYRFLGYGKGWSIVEEEAETVREIYDMYLKGERMASICKKLEQEGKKRQDGGTRWHVGSISYILNNTAYTGDILLQKSITTNYIGRVRKKNEGEEPMYYVENHHAGIIGKETYAKVQLELKRRSGHSPADYSVSPFFGTIFTAPRFPSASGNGVEPLRDNKGGTAEEESRIPYRRITIHSNVEKWKKAVWKPQAPRKKKDDGTQVNLPNIRYPTITEENLYHIFQKGLAGLRIREAEISAEIKCESEQASEKIAGIEEERSTGLAALKRKLNELAGETNAELREEIIKDYNRMQCEYEALGDAQFALEQKIAAGKRLTANWELIKAAASQTGSEQEKEKLSEAYRALGANMDVGPDQVTVLFGAGITEQVEIEKVGKSWRASPVDCDLAALGNGGYGFPRPKRAASE